MKEKYAEIISLISYQVFLIYSFQLLSLQFEPNLEVLNGY